MVLPMGVFEPLNDPAYFAHAAVDHEGASYGMAR
jgi:hypothetical protein